MIGLAALLFLFLWVFIAYRISVFIYRKFKIQSNKHYIKLPIFFLIFLLPLADDIVGGIQFRILCGNNSVPFVNEEKAKNKNLMSTYINSELSGYVLPIKETTYFYKDMSTNEVVVKWKWFRSSGGWLARIIKFNSSELPFTFNAECQPEYSGNSINKKLNINITYQTN